jgi:probable rRNA maturation factor
MAVEIIIEDARWEQENLTGLAQSAERATLAYFGLNPAEFEISALGGNDARLAELNASFREKPSATNVLSWPALDRSGNVPGARPVLPTMGDAPELGDIALAYETCQREAEAAKLVLSDHVLHLFVHGILHLLGYDHENEQDAMVMQSSEIEILSILGVGNPYSDLGDLPAKVER